MLPQNDLVQSSYNKFSTFPYVSYNIIKYLMGNEEDLWKILKYSNPDAWAAQNLTTQEKAALIHSGQPNETDFRVFNTLGQDNTWTIEACILRIAPAVLIPATYAYGHMSIGFEMYCHFKIVSMSNYTSRLDFGAQRLIECLNGADIEGVGRLYFDYRASTAARSMPMGAIPYKGRATIMCNYNLG